MASKVGQKGQIVIEKEIRNRLGVLPGWIALQILVDDHVEVYFAPPEHNRSLAGILAPYVKRSLPPEEWHQAVEKAWEEAVREKFGALTS
ncbi:MAG: AbrB/MazE/SpoVT family DNA-binding domain-containing protein [Chloroflexi bacterium]|nr:AbrB/MazE/SpoVT family DNA-binding domain-containing protein [Chloroflexota bacterium]